MRKLLLSISILALPSLTFAQQLSPGEMFDIVGYALIGITGAVSVVIMITGFIVYIVRLGTDRRITGIHIMEWGIGFIIASLFVITALKLIERWFGI